MRTDELLAAVRATGQIPSADPVYTSARILLELTDVQQQLFERLFVATRDGYFLHRYTVSTVSGTPAYRLPARSIVQGAERVELAGSDGRYHQLEKLGARDASGWSGATSSEPRAFTMRGDSIELHPTPNGVYTLRVHYYLRPSKLVTQQVTGTERGRVISIDNTAHQLLINAFPYDQSLAVPAEITSAQQHIDVIRPDGGHDVVVVDSTQVKTTVFGNFILTVPATVDLSDVAVGDYVRVAEQSDWPQLPQEMHRTLCDACAAAILLSKGFAAKAGQLAQKVSSDVGRFTDLMNPRIKDQPKVLRPRYGVGRGARFPNRWPVG